MRDGKYLPAQELKVGAQGMKRWVTVPAFISKTAVPPEGEVPSTAATPVTYFAMAVNANSTLRPLFALVSIKGTPYSCGTRHRCHKHLPGGFPGAPGSCRAPANIGACGRSSYPALGEELCRGGQEKLSEGSQLRCFLHNFGNNF